MAATEVPCNARSIRWAYAPSKARPAARPALRIIASGGYQICPFVRPILAIDSSCQARPVEFPYAHRTFCEENVHLLVPVGNGLMVANELSHSGVVNMSFKLKSVSGAFLCGLLLLSLGASAADKHKCKDGMKWDATTKACVKK